MTINISLEVAITRCDIKYVIWNGVTLNMPNEVAFTWSDMTSGDTYVRYDAYKCGDTCKQD